MAEKKNPEPEKDYKDPTVNEDGIITYDVKPHDAMMVVIWEFNIAKKSTNE